MIIIIDPFLRPSLSLLVEVAFFSSEPEAAFSGDKKKRGGHKNSKFSARDS
jgi:hypothetical protein